MSEFTLIDNSNGNEREFDTKSEAEEQKQDLLALGADSQDLEIIHRDESNGPDDSGDVNTQAENKPASDGGQAPVVEADVPEEPPAVDENPTDWLPSHFVDTIQGVPTVNRMGYAVIASQYGVEVTAEPVTLPSETEHEYAEFRAVAITEDGREYSGFGSAHVDRQDGDDPHLLAELAETRAMKRACAWSTGVGMTAASEMMNEL